MADNAYTAFDPVFWSYHANIDRMMEVWIRAHPAAQFTAGFPIQPFMGPTALVVNETDPRRWLYTTIGDLARDSHALGYDYGAPATPGCQGDSVADDAAAKQRLSVVFSGVRCTHESYTIDAFLNQTAPGEADIDPDNPHYVGRFSRIGMGISDDKGLRRSLDFPRASLLVFSVGGRLGIRDYCRLAGALPLADPDRTTVGRSGRGVSGFEACSFIGPPPWWSTSREHRWVIFRERRR